MTPTEKKRVDELTDAINTAKTELMNEQRYMSNRATYDALAHIGELVSERNNLTGETSDIKYLYLDDGEWYRVVAGFIGDDAERTDINGTPLKIGDTVELTVDDGKPYSRLIMSIFLDQGDLDEAQAKKTKDYTEMDIKHANSIAFTVTENSCLEDYKESLTQRMDLSI